MVQSLGGNRRKLPEASSSGVTQDVLKELRQYV